jgi:hypothetical protein
MRSKKNANLTSDNSLVSLNRGQPDGSRQIHQAFYIEYKPLRIGVEKL